MLQICFARRKRLIQNLFNPEEKSVMLDIIVRVIKDGDDYQPNIIFYYDYYLE